MKNVMKKIGERKFENEKNYILTPASYGITVAGDKKTNYILTPEAFGIVVK